MMKKFLCLAVLIMIISGAVVKGQQPEIQQKYVGLIGCSNSRQIGDAYTDVSLRRILWNAGQGNMNLHAWATSDQPWVLFDKYFAVRGATAFWYPLCIHVGDYTSLDAAYADFLLFYARLRQRSQVQLWLSPYIGSQLDCKASDLTMQLEVVTMAVDNGLAEESFPQIPPASSPWPDHCHFYPQLSSNVGIAAVQFLDR